MLHANELHGACNRFACTVHIMNNARTENEQSVRALSVQ